MTTPVTETEHPDYEYEGRTTGPTAAPPACSTMCIALAAASAVILVLGVAENGLVIWTAGLKVKKSVSTTWYLGLAVSDFTFCAVVLFDAIDVVRSESDFGRFMCKFSSFLMSFNMFSSVFLLVIISVDRCVVVAFPVWAQNRRTVRKASVIVLLAWIMSAALSAPAAVYQDVQPDELDQATVCLYDASDQERTAEVVNSFVFGFVIPFLIIVACYVVIVRKLRKSDQRLKFKKPLRTMTALTATFLLCWLPLHVFALMDLNSEEQEDLHQTEEVLVLILACADSFLTPLISVCMRKDFRKHVKTCVSCFCRNASA